MESQKKKILRWMRRGHRITALQALNRFDCLSLRARISEIIKEGQNIDKKMIQLPSGKWVKQYWIRRRRNDLSI